MFTLPMSIVNMYPDFLPRVDLLLHQKLLRPKQGYPPRRVVNMHFFKRLLQRQRNAAKSKKPTFYN